MAATNPGTDNLVAYYGLDEESGTRYDSVGSNDLTDNNTVLYDTGIQGNAAKFVSANTEYLSVADPFYLGASFTIVLWFSLDDFTQAGNQYFFNKWDTGSNSREIRAYYNGTDDNIYLQIDTNGSTPVTTLSTLDGVDASDTLYCLMIWADGSDVYMSLNDGAPISTSFGTLYNGTAALEIGNVFDGLIDEVAFFDDELSGDEQEWMYNSGSGRTYSEIVGATEVDVPLGTMAITGYAPRVDPIQVPAGALAVSGYAPALSLSVPIPLGKLKLTGYAPLINGETIHIRTADGATLLGSVADGSAAMMVSDGDEWFALSLPKLT